MERTDDLAPTLFVFLLIGIAVFAISIGTLTWWQRRFQPSPPTTYATWAGFLWSYVNFLGLAIVPEYLIAETILTAAVCGAVVIIFVWSIATLIHSRNSR